MHQGQKAIVWFNEVTKKDIPLVGGILSSLPHSVFSGDGN
ncbi:unnamed protein product [marine sediment metagenome]|uniref:Uncharacterized protein n=1 Tax=marine sediment metagenome TaxID=412755 RepID=X0ZCT7_9ZZZZ